jgi:hypothetical protein
MKQPEKIGREFGWGGGASFGQYRFPEAFELGGGVLTDPPDHDCWALGEHRVQGEWVRSGGASMEFAVAFENG